MKYTFSPYPGAAAPPVLAAMAKPYGTEADDLMKLNEDRFIEIFFPDAAQLSLLPLTRELLTELVFNSFTDASPILIGVNGPLSTQLMNTAKLLNKDFEILDANFGSDFRPAQLEKALEAETFSAFLFVETDPYSGVRLDIAAMAEAIRMTQPDALILVEGSSALGVHEPLQIGRDVDVYFAGLDGSFGVPAGLSLIALSERANLKTFSGAAAGLMLNFSRQKQLADRVPLFASRLYPQLHAVEKQIDRIFLEGLENRETRLKRIAENVRAWFETKGFTTLAESDCASVGSTVVKRKPIFTARSLVDYCAAYGVYLGMCPDELEEDYFVVAHQGDCDEEDCKVLFSVLEKFIAEYDTDLKVKPNALRDFFKRGG